MKTLTKNAKPVLRSRGFIGARPSSSVSADTGAPKPGMDGPARSRGVIQPHASQTPASLDTNIKRSGRFSLKQ